MDDDYKAAVDRVKLKSASYKKDAKESKEEVKLDHKVKSNSPLRQETIDGLKLLAKTLENAPQKIEEKPTEVKEEEEIDDTYFYDETGTQRPNIYSTKRRKEIESRCQPIDILTMLTKQRAEQIVPIVPDKFVVKFRDLNGKEDIFIKQQMAKEIYTRDGLDVSKAYMTSKFGLLRLTFALLSINSRNLSDIQIQNGKIDEAAFWEKHEYISNFPIDILEDLDWQLLCFMDRIKKVSIVDIKNF